MIQLTWPGKETTQTGELLKMNSQEFGDPVSNRLIMSDNLPILIALHEKYGSHIRCAIIDPPYNTGKKFSHYDDNIEHAAWLSFMKDRIIWLQKLLANDGSLWIMIDDDECHYVKVLCDEIFGRKNFIANVVWQKKYSPQNDARWFSDNHDHILLYAKNKEIWKPNLLPRTARMDRRYKNPDNDPRGPWKCADFSVKTYSATCDYTITAPSGRKINPPQSRCWSVNPNRYQELIADKRIWFGKKGSNVPSLKLFLSEVQQGSVPKTIWPREEVGDNQEAKKEAKRHNEDSFATPKPERLIQRILQISTNPGDMVLDCFAGSGTTGAVAHKMKRPWIMIEQGPQCESHILPRMTRIVLDLDPYGITQESGWAGGSGFRFFKPTP